MLYTVRIDPNRTFLRALMSAFYASSSKARELLSLTQTTSAITEEREHDCFAKAWEAAKPLKHLPLTQRLLDEIDIRATANVRTMHTDSKARLFSHLNDFIRHIKSAADCEGKGQFAPSRLSSEFAFRLPVYNGDKLADKEKKAFLEAFKLEVKQNFPTLIAQLRNEELRSMIVADYTPAALERMDKADAAAVAAAEAVKHSPLHLDFLPVTTPPLPILPEGISFGPAEGQPAAEPMAAHLH